VFITINFDGSINKIEENWKNPTFFIQDGRYLFTNLMSGAARLPALGSISLLSHQHHYLTTHHQVHLWEPVGMNVMLQGGVLRRWDAIFQESEV